MLKLVLLSMLVIVPAWSQSEVRQQLPYKLYKIRPSSKEAVQYLKKSALSAAERYPGLPPIFLTPLGQDKTSYVLIPHASNQNITGSFQRQHIPYKPVDVANIKSAQLNNEMHKPSEFPLSYSRGSGQGYLIESPRITNWGSWGDWGECQDGQYVVGMQLKTEHNQGAGDDTALNAIKLLCAAPGSHSYNAIRSLEGEFGNWGRTFYCPNDSQVTGFQLRSEPNLGGGDDTAGNNLRIFCSSDSGQMIEGDGEVFGSWTDRQNCLNGQAVAGFRTQIEGNQGGGDDTSLNNVDMECVDLPKKNV